MDKQKLDETQPAPPAPVLPMPVDLPASDAERSSSLPPGHDRTNLEDPLLPPEPSHDINP